ncbi:MAG: folate-binding protein YgfZ [Sphingomonadaceae bacterium]|nr:folate-binding protein YgfZ [Sphingomonadaceae bacterium]
MPTARLTDRAVLRVGGAEARDFLQGLVTNDVALLAPGKPLWAGLLSAQGKLLFDMVLHDAAAGDGSVFVDVAAAAAEALAKRLTMYKLRRAVTITPEPELHVFAAWGAPLADLPHDPQLAALGQRWVADAAPADATLADYAAHRLRAGVADSGDLLLDRMLWLEANAVELNGVSFTKGCYVGQENTARMHHRDRLRRRLLPVTVDGEPGDVAIRAGDTPAGELRRHADGRGIAYLRVEAADGPLTAGGATLTVDWPAWLPRA